MILTHTADFVLEQMKLLREDLNDSLAIRYGRYLDKIENHANFIKQNLSEKYEVNGVLAHPLNRFVPTDLDGNVLGEPKDYNLFIGNGDATQCVDVNWFRKCQQYQQAKERVLFEGAKYHAGAIFLDNVCIYHESAGFILSKTPSDMLYMHELILTPTAQKMIGINK